MAFSIETRQQAIKKLQETEQDLLIIGGGITGAGVAVQASAAGMAVGLIEMQDFAEGTSSRSTKLVHGGIRYLKNFDVEVVADTVTERAVVQGIAPHIPKPAPMLLPIYDEPSSTFNMFSVKVAMDLYDHLAGITGGEYGNTLLTREEVLAREPDLKEEGLLGGGVYLDFKNNDARLVIENIKQAAADGGQMVSRAKATGFIYDRAGKITGVTVTDLLTGEVFDVMAKLVINTGGPWVDEVRRLDKRHELEPHIRPTKGVHLVIDSRKLTVPQPTYLDTGKGDGRMFFVVPREDKTYFGTTDTDYQGDYTHPEVSAADVDYLLECLNDRFPAAQVTLADIEASWVGLRPLIASNSGSDYNGGDNGAISTESFERVLAVVKQYEQKEVERSAVETVLNNLGRSLSESENNPSAVSRGSELTREENGLLTLAGGKITDYRKMAEGAMILISEIMATEFGKTIALIESKAYQVSGGKLDPQNVAAELADLAKLGVEKGLSVEDATYLTDLYGSNVPEVFDQIATLEAFAGLSLTESLALNYAMNAEMALTPVDYFLRRTNRLLFMRDRLDELRTPVVEAMAQRYKWTEAMKSAYVVQLTQAIEESDLKALKKERY